MTIRNRITAGLFWGTLWRASLYGVLLGAAFGGFYGAAFGTLIFPLVGTMIGLVFGTPAGALVGLPLGLLDGLALILLALGYREYEFPNPRRYRLQAGALCALVSLLALVGDWAQHGLPEPAYFATGRAFCLSVNLIDPPCSQVRDTGMPPDPFALTIWVLVPLTMAVFASWLTGRFVTGWYAGAVSET